MTAERNHVVSGLHIDGVLRVLATDLDPETIRPKRVYRRNRYFARNELSRLCLGVFRTAGGELLSSGRYRGSGDRCQRLRCCRCNLARSDSGANRINRQTATSGRRDRKYRGRTREQVEAGR